MPISRVSHVSKGQNQSPVATSRMTLGRLHETSVFELKQYVWYLDYSKPGYGITYISATSTIK